MLHRFTAGSRTAIRWRLHGNPLALARQYADRQRGNARIVHRSVQLSEDECGSLHTWLKTGIDCCSHATAEALSNGQPFCHTHPRYFFYTYVYLWSHNKTGSASQATWRHKWLSPFSTRIRAEFLSRFFRTASCGKSTQYHAENLCRYPCPPALEIRGILGKNVSYMCQVP